MDIVNNEETKWTCLRGDNSHIRHLFKVAVYTNTIKSDGI